MQDAYDIYPILILLVADEVAFVSEVTVSTLYVIDGGSHLRVLRKDVQAIFE